MNKYEGMFIFPEGMSEDELDGALEKVKAEIERAEGTVTAATKLGRRPFARMMNKQTSGMYYVISFDMTGDQLAALRDHLKFNEDIFRAEFYRAEKPVVNVPKEPAAAEA